ncbi:hypothetical protein [Mesorhizobium sp. M7A.F.Ca.US.008.03.1.1]|uniref:hypothetical protein n=1 Tax=Mesorhizobium sp. M7A.F.Ca.US.008.03.1.1 TaxID=2496742 RepID=UPI000FCB16BF|nr:hypothetical protein [Mesorhizobium sp. M7A.F.Ca.US.008.03.1.1]RUW58709.1 hypothetical protein EOA16_25850 [Mesorhizobium sp. M7A.F.Ca.US.008.03.1.1]
MKLKSVNYNPKTSKKVSDEERVEVVTLEMTAPPDTSPSFSSDGRIDGFALYQDCRSERLAMQASEKIENAQRPHQTNEVRGKPEE